MSNVDGRFATGTVFPINPSSHSLSSPLTPLNPAKSGNLPSFACICPTTDISWPGVPGNCFPAAWQVTCGTSLVGVHWEPRERRNLSSFLVPTALGRAHHSLMLRGNLPAHAFLHSTFHINPICTRVPALQLVWKVRDSLAYHLL